MLKISFLISVIYIITLINIKYMIVVYRKTYKIYGDIDCLKSRGALKRRLHAALGYK